VEWREAFAFRAKAGNTAVSLEYSRTTGSVWTLACLDRRTMLVPSWRIGPRSPATLERLRADTACRYVGLTAGCHSETEDEREVQFHVCPAWFAALEHGFARKVERHAAVVALYFLYYNFSLILPEIGTTPAIAAGKATHVWSAAEIAALVPESATRCSAG
jgi:hypothetical protein